MKKIKKSGFSLIELLVVISVIGILVAMGTVAYSGAQKRSRDAKRRGDIQAIQDAFEQYYAENSSYDADCTVVEDYLSGGMPLDPKEGVYTDTSCSSDGYCICASLEIADGGNASDGSCTWDASGDYFCVSNLQ